MSIQTIHVRTDPEYDVVIGPGLLQECGSRLRGAVPLCHMAVVTDSNVAPLYLETVKSSLQEAGYQVSACVFPAGEGSKNFDTLSKILEFLAEEQLTRTDCVAALGGGVTGDMAGLAAALYLRGVKYVQLPTTLLSAVDSSVGGKTAIDLKAGKNLAGAFLQPSAVICDTDCLKTLPQDVFADGAAEALKTGVLCSEALFARMEFGLRVSELEEIIAQCVAFKAGVVERDEKEQGERKLLNLGHTVGHAIEKCSDFRIPHGHAVAAGLAIMTRAAENLGWMTGESKRTLEAERIESAVETLGLPSATKYPPAALAQAALRDKKRAGDSITIVVPSKIGRCELKTIPVTELQSIIEAGWALE